MNHIKNKDKTQPNSILIIDDNPTDALLMKEAFALSEINSEIHIIDDSCRALQFIKEQNPLPNIILLDLNMPKKSGLEVLTELRSDPKSSFIPVIIFTSSDAPEDVKTAYEQGSNAYVRKPGDFESYIRIARSIRDFWFSAAIIY